MAGLCFNSIKAPMCITVTVGFAVKS